MQSFSDTVTPPSVEQVERAHDTLSAADVQLVTDLLRALAEEVRDSTVIYLDDIDVHTIDRAENSPYDHVNEKEVVSGDATAWFAVEDEHGEDIEQVDIQYGIYAGTAQNVNGYIYDPLEVEVVPK